jgi:adenylate kinase
MEVLLQEARDSYEPEIIVELMSNDTDEMESNVDRIGSWLKQWKKDNTETTDETAADEGSGQ